MMPLYLLAAFGKNEKSDLAMQNGNNWRTSLTNWSSTGANAMATAFTEIAAGLSDAIAHTTNDTTQAQSGVILHAPQPLDVQAIRRKTGLSQQQFCATFGISLGRLRNWEQGLRTPHGPAQVLLKVVDRNPKAVMETLASGGSSN